MNGTKWYKLNKSNESLQVFFEEYFEKLETTISDKISAAIKSFGELIFSAVLAFFLEISFDPLNSIWNKISFLQGEKYISLKVIISCGSVFIIILMSCRLLVWLGAKIKAFFSDNKATPGDAYRLEKYFYKQILNEIVTGISLEKKACELEKNMESSETLEQDKALYKIYLIEAVFYFNETTYNISKHNIIEINNEEREQYTEFLNSMNPVIIYSIFEMCVSTLERIICGLEKYGQSSQGAENAKKMFEQYMTAIKKQTSMLSDTLGE